MKLRIECYTFIGGGSIGNIKIKDLLDSHLDVGDNPEKDDIQTYKEMTNPRVRVFESPRVPDKRHEEGDWATLLLITSSPDALVNRLHGDIPLR